MSIADMKVAVKAMMLRKYGSVAVTLTPATDEQIAGKYYVREKDAAAIRTVCTRSGYSVSFRTAGQHTLGRIDAGNPCKGHTIMTKSIKEKGNAYTYSNLNSDEFTKLKGLVGFPLDGVPEVPVLDYVWKITGKNGQDHLDTKVTALANTDRTVYFTGDYDMHDLLKTSGGRTDRILPSVDEEAAIDAINKAILAVDTARQTKVTASLTDTPDVRVRNSQYALIRHGAQTSFLSYLLGPGGAELKPDPKAPPGSPARIPLEAAVNNIDASICIFDALGNAYILEGVAAIYKYYAANNLLDQISFYYFFNDLRKNNVENDRVLNGYADEINGYIRGCGYPN